MSTFHGEPGTQKPISEIAAYIKNLIPAEIPAYYVLNPMFESIANEENIRNGVIAFRDFLYTFCDRLISEGDSYVKLPKKPKSETDYPFLYHIADLLVDIGYYGKLSESADSLLLTGIPSSFAAVDENGNKKKSKNPASKLMDCIRFLSLCGFVFDGIDLDAKAFSLPERSVLQVSYPAAPVLSAGLKAMAIADMDLRIKRYKNDNNHDNLLRCDYRLLKEADTDIVDALKDFVHPLPEKVQKFALELHQHYIDTGVTCAAIISTFEFHFAYSDIRNSRRILSPRDIYQKRVWEFSLSPRDGYCLAVRTKKTDKYAEVIETFPPYLGEKILRGYGCDRKLRNEPCQRGCQGILLPLDESILDISEYIKIWLDHEV